jgi:hypothetical protein
VAGTHLQQGWVCGAPSHRGLVQYLQHQANGKNQGTAGGLQLPPVGGHYVTRCLLWLAAAGTLACCWCLLSSDIINEGDTLASAAGSSTIGTLTWTARTFAAVFERPPVKYAVWPPLQLAIVNISVGTCSRGMHPDSLSSGCPCIAQSGRAWMQAERSVPTVCTLSRHTSGWSSTHLVAPAFKT